MPEGARRRLLSPVCTRHGSGRTAKSSIPPPSSPQPQTATAHRDPRPHAGLRAEGRLRPVARLRQCRSRCRRRIDPARGRTILLEAYESPPRSIAWQRFRGTASPASATTCRIGATGRDEDQIRYAEKAESAGRSGVAVLIQAALRKLTSRRVFEKLELAAVRVLLPWWYSRMPDRDGWEASYFLT